MITLRKSLNAWADQLREWTLSAEMAWLRPKYRTGRPGSEHEGSRASDRREPLECWWYAVAQVVPVAGGAG